MAKPTVVVKLPNVLNQSIGTFNIESFDEIVKNIRNARRHLLDETNDVDYVKKQLVTARAALVKAIDGGDAEEYNEATGVVRSLMKKLSEGPTVQLDKFNAAMDSLAEFTKPYVEPVVESVIEEKAA